MFLIQLKYYKLDNKQLSFILNFILYSSQPRFFFKEIAEKIFIDRRIKNILLYCYARP